MSPEEWRAVVGWSGHYEVSDWGRVRSLDKQVTGRYGCMVRKKGRILSHGVHLPRPGYPLVSLWRRNKGTSVNVHALVMAAFPERIRGRGKVSNHINGIKTDNRPENLERCSYSENIKHAWDTGLRKFSRETSRWSRYAGGRK